MEMRLVQNGWQDRCAVVVISPELEIWAWNDMRGLTDYLHWTSMGYSLGQWLEHQGFLTPGENKPRDPKSAFLTLLRQLDWPQSSDTYGELAQRLELDGCTDPAFAKLRSALSRWFLPDKSSRIR